MPNPGKGLGMPSGFDSVSAASSAQMPRLRAALGVFVRRVIPGNIQIEFERDLVEGTGKRFFIALRRNQGPDRQCVQRRPTFGAICDFPAKVTDQDTLIGQATSYASDDACLVDPSDTQGSMACPGLGVGGGGAVQRAKEHGQVAFPFQSFRRGRQLIVQLRSGSADEHQGGELVSEHRHAGIFEITPTLVNTFRKIGHDPRAIPANRCNCEPLRNTHPPMLSGWLAAAKNKQEMRCG
ncbi:MAG: hypothetical protein ACI91F_000112 [Candidatus Binatia bacterium]|jgi:hypothetical protein